jgi:hypothetical protein
MHVSSRCEPHRQKLLVVAVLTPQCLPRRPCALSLDVLAATVACATPLAGISTFSSRSNNLPTGLFG